MSRFGDDPLAFFDSVYEGVAPWDIGGPQPALVSMFTDFPPAGPVLDVGCGSGDLAIALARTGLDVLGLDFAEAAIAGARERAATLPTDVAGRLDFQVGDALHPSTLQRRFGAVVDSGFYHLFDAGECARLANELAATLRPGGRYYLLAFAVEFPVANTPRRISEPEIREHFAEDAGWRVLDVRQAEFQSRIAPVPAVCACIERQPAATFTPA